MKKIILTIFSLIISLGFVYAEFTSIDNENISNTIKLIQKSVNDSDIESLTIILSPNVSETLKQDIQNNIVGKNISYQQDIGTMEEMEGDKIKVKGKFSAKGINWSISGLSNYFIFEKIENNRYLVDSNFASRFDMSNILKTIGKIFLYVGPIILLFSAFWIWMIVDASERKLKNPTKRILILIFFNWFGAVLYYFTARKQDIKKQKGETIDDFISGV